MPRTTEKSGNDLLTDLPCARPNTFSNPPQGGSPPVPNRHSRGYDGLAPSGNEISNGSHHPQGSIVAESFTTRVPESKMVARKRTSPLPGTRDFHFSGISPRAYQQVGMIQIVYHQAHNSQNWCDAAF
jgi:hypothetical protein